MKNKTSAALCLSLFLLPIFQVQADDDACYGVVLTLIGYTQKTETQFLYADGGCYDFRTRLVECNKNGKASEYLKEHLNESGQSTFSRVLSTCKAYYVHNGDGSERKQLTHF